MKRRTRCVTHELHDDVLESIFDVASHNKTRNVAANKTIYEGEIVFFS